MSWPAAGNRAASRWSRRRPPHANSCCGFTTASTCAVSRKRPAAPSSSIPTPTHRRSRTILRCWRRVPPCEAVDHALSGSHRTRARAGAAAGPSCRARSRDGILSVQQRRGRRRARARQWRREGRHRRLRRASRQRHAAHLRRRSARALRFDAPVSVLSRHRRGGRSRSRRRRAASRSTCRSRSARSTRTTRRCSPRWSCRCFAVRARSGASCRPASTPTSAIRSRACASRPAHSPR